MTTPEIEGLSKELHEVFQSAEPFTALAWGEAAEGYRNAVTAIARHVLARERQKQREAFEAGACLHPHAITLGYNGCAHCQNAREEAERRYPDLPVELLRDASGGPTQNERLLLDALAKVGSAVNALREQVREKEERP